MAEHDSFIGTGENMQEISISTRMPSGSWRNVANPGESLLQRFTGSSGDWPWGTWPQ
jgi:hypothetical protein